MNGGMQPPSQDIYKRDEVSSRVHRRRLRWFLANKPPWPTTSNPMPPPPTPAEPQSDDPFSHRRRRRRRHNEHTPQAELLSRFTWIGVSVIAIGYLVMLMASELRGRKQPPPLSATTPPEASAPTNTAATLPDAEVAEESDSKPIAERIATWNKGQRLLNDLAKRIDNTPPDEAEATLRLIVQDAPAFTHARMELARVLARQKKYAEAQQLMIDVLDSDPDRLEARIELGEILLARSRNEDALAVARWIIESDSHSIPAHEMAAAALLNQDATTEAIVYLKRLITLNRDDLNNQNNLGAAYLKIADFRSAAQVFREVLRIDADNSVAYYNLAVTLARQKQASETVDVLSQAVSRFGLPFVTTWVQGADFDEVRNDPLFQSFLVSDARRPTPSDTEHSEPSAEPAPATEPGS